MIISLRESINELIHTIEGFDPITKPGLIENLSWIELRYHFSASSRLMHYLFVLGIYFFGIKIQDGIFPSWIQFFELVLWTFL